MQAMRPGPRGALRGAIAIVFVSGLTISVACSGDSVAALDRDGGSCAGGGNNCVVATITVGGTSTTAQFDADQIVVAGGITSFGVSAIDDADGSGDVRRAILFTINAPSIAAKDYVIPGGSSTDQYVVGLSYVEGDGPQDPAYRLFKADAQAGGSGNVLIRHWNGVEDNSGEFEVTAVGTVGSSGSVTIKGAFLVVGN